MTSITRLRRLARTSYSIASRPLRAADRAVGHLEAGSTVRTAVERGVSTVEAAAQRLFGTSTPTPADAAHDGNDEPTRSSDGDAPGADTRQQGDTPAVDRIAGEAASPAPVGERERVAEELLEDLEEAPLVGELAEAPEDEKQRMADLRAKHLVEEFEAEQRARHARFQQS